MTSSGQAVRDSLARLRDRLASAAPALAARLDNPAPAADLAALETKLGRPLPNALRALYQVADGDGDVIEAEEDMHGLLLGATACPRWIRGMRWLSTVEARRALFQCRDEMAESFAPSWLPVASDDCGSFVVLDEDSGALFAIDHEDPGRKPEHDVSAALPDLLAGIVDGLQSGAIRCDGRGFYRPVTTEPVLREPAAALLQLLIERQLVELAEGCTIADGVPYIRRALASRTDDSAVARKLARLLEEAGWVEETFASDDLLEVLVSEFR